MCLYHKHGGQRGYRGHILNLPQDIQGFLDQLPGNINELPILCVRRTINDNRHMDFRVHQHRVLAAIQWLIAIQWLVQSNPFYSDITINFTNLNQLPHDGIPETLQSLSEDPSEPSVDENPQPMCDSISFLPIPSRESTEHEGICSILTGKDPFDWPTVDSHPINEFKTAGLATMVFPTLFPFGTGDPTCPSRQYAITLSNGFKHLM